MYDFLSQIHHECISPIICEIQYREVISQWVTHALFLRCHLREFPLNFVVKITSQKS